MSASEARSHKVAESIRKTHDELLHEKARNEALSRTVKSLIGPVYSAEAS